MKSGSMKDIFNEDNLDRSGTPNSGRKRSIMKEAAINQLATKKQQKGGFFSCFCIKGNIQEAEEERQN